MPKLKKRAGPQERRIDRIDRRLLTLLQEDGHLTSKDLAAKVFLSPTPCLRRLGLLKEAGYITRYKAVLDPIKLGYRIRAFIMIRRSRESDRDTVWRQVSSIPEVIACHVVSGEYDLFVELVARDMEHYGSLTLNTIATIDGVFDLRSTFSIMAIKTDGNLPLVD